MASRPKASLGNCEIFCIDIDQSWLPRVYVLSNLLSVARLALVMQLDVSGIEWRADYDMLARMYYFVKINDVLYAR